MTTAATAATAATSPATALSAPAAKACGDCGDFAQGVWGKARAHEVAAKGSQAAPQALTDDRVVCAACAYLVASRRCRNWQTARLTTPEVLPLVQLPQRCPGYAPNDSETEAQTETDRAQTETTQPIQPEENQMIVSETASGASYTPCPPGSYLARCCRLVDLGTQTTDYQGEAKTAHKVMCTFEILDSEARRDDGEPFTLSKRYTMSLHEKAALRKELASWRGRDFTPEELRGFDLRNILGAVAFISVVETTKGDRTYANIASIMKAPKGMQAPQGSEPLLYWSMSEAKPAWEVFAQLHPKLQAQIEASPEFAKLKRPARVAMPAAAPAAPTAPADAGSGFDDMADDLTF